MNLLADPPQGKARVTGGLLGVAGGEAWRGAPGGFESGGPVTAALLDLCRAYTAFDEDDTPVRVALRHQGVPGVGWLLPVAVVRSGTRIIDETITLATAAGTPPDVLDACLTYVTLAAELLVARPVEAAVEVATCKPFAMAVDGATRRAGGTEPSRPRLLGIGAVDAVNAGIWALTQTRYQLATLAASLAHWCEPWVAAAAGGLLGLRDGCASVPAQWYRRVRASQECLALAPALLRVDAGLRARTVVALSAHGRGATSSMAS
jgi:hypothetical protein